MSVIIYSFNWNISPKMSQGMLECDIVIYRITYLWFSNERFCNKKRVLFVLDPVFYYYILLLLFSFLKLWLAGSTFRFLVLNLDRMNIHQNLQWHIHRSIFLHLSYLWRFPDNCRESASQPLFKYLIWSTLYGCMYRAWFV